MSAGVAVTAYQQAAWQGKAKLRANHMHDPLAWIADREMCDPMHI
jgi:hypothetical protein